jgi:hypothetical protein
MDYEELLLLLDLYYHDYSGLLDYYGLLQWIMASKSHKVNPMPHPPVCYTPILRSQIVII